MSTQLDQIAKKAKSNPKLRFTSLAHLLDTGVPHGNLEADEPAGCERRRRRGRRRSLNMTWTIEFKNYANQVL